MSVIIRLQGLAWTASAMNIRHFFQGLNIPAGGVHIIGGDGGDAFIAFASDDDARMAMKMNMCPLNGMPVQLFLSSKSEMQSVIDAARSGHSNASAQTAAGGTGSGGAPNLPQQQQMQQYQNAPPSNFPLENQNHPSNSASAAVQQETNDFNQPNVQGQYGSHEWQGFPRYGGRMEDGQAQVAPPQFKQNPLMDSDRLSDTRMGGGARGVGDSSGNFPPPGVQQTNQMRGGRMGMQSQMYPMGASPQPDADMMDRMKTLPQGGMVSNKGFMAESQLKLNQGNRPESGGVEQKDETTGLLGISAAVGRGQDNVGGTMGMDSRRDAMKMPGRLGAGVHDAGLPDQMAGNRGSFNDSLLGPPGGVDRSGGVDDQMRDGAHSAFPPPDRFHNQVLGNPMGNAGGDNLFQDQWIGGKQQESQFPDVKTFDRGVADESMGRSQGMERRPFDQFPGTSLPDHDTGRLNRAGTDFPPAEESDPMMRRPARDSQFPRDMRLDGKFPEDSEQARRFPPNRFSARNDRPMDTFVPDDRRGEEDALPSTQYPPEDDQFPDSDRRNAPGDIRPQGGFPSSMRGRFDDKPFIPEDRQGPPGERMPPVDNKFPPSEQQRYTGDDRGFPPRNRGFPPEDRLPRDERFPKDDRRYPEGRRFPPDERRFPMEEGRFAPDDGKFPSDRLGMGPGNRPSRSDDFGGRRPGDGPFPPEENRFREREDELRRRDMFDRPRFDSGREGRPDFHSGFRDFGGNDNKGRPFMSDRGFPTDRRNFRRDDGERDGQPPFGFMGDQNDGPPRWNRFRNSRGEQDVKPFPPKGGPPMDHTEMRHQDKGGLNMTNMEGPMDMDQRVGQVGSNYLDRPKEENTFDYGHGPVGDMGRMGGGNMMDDFNDYDNRYPPGRGGHMDRPPRGRGDSFFNRNRGGPPYGRGGRGMDVDRRFDEPGPEGRFNDTDTRNVGGMPPDFPNRPPMPGPKGNMPDLNNKPGTSRGLLGDGPPNPNPENLYKNEEMKPVVPPESDHRDLEHRSSRGFDREHYSDRDRRDRDRDERRLGDRDRYSRFRHERDRDRRRSRSKDRSRDRDRRRSRSRDRSSSSKKEADNLNRRSDTRSRNVVLKNMPKTISYKDVRRFMQPLDVPFDGLKVINDQDGRRVGEAYVRFNRVDDAMRAVRRHGDKMDGQSVNVTFCSDEEFNKAVDSFKPTLKKEIPAPSAVPSAPEPKKTSVKADTPMSDQLCYILQLTNLPLSIKKQDISQFFKGLKINNNGQAIYIEYDDTGIATGKGYVEFETDIDYKKALTQNATVLGTVTIRVVPGKKEDAMLLKAKQEEMLQRANLRTMGGPAAVNSMNMQRPSVPPGRPGLMGPRPHQIPALQQNPTIRPNQMPSPSVNSPTPGSIRMPVPPSVSPGNQETSPSTQEGVCVHIQGLPLLATPQDIREFFADCQIALRGINIAHDSRGKPLGEGFVEFKFPQDFERAIKKDKTSFGRHIVAVKPIGKKEMMERLDKARQQGFSQSKSSPQNTDTPPQPQAPVTDKKDAAEAEQKPKNADQSAETPKTLPQAPKPNVQESSRNSASQAPQSKPAVPISQGPTHGGAGAGSKTIPPGVLNKNWFYVRCQNFPPDISIVEIMHFFQGFRPLGDSIRLHYSSDGKPTGNAVVGFGSLEEAHRALQRLNMQVCRQNVVTLHPA